MARQSKKILKKIQPKEKDKKPKEKPEKIGKDYILIAVITITVVFMLLGWTYFSNLHRGLYVALAVSLITTYVRRHTKLNEKQNYWVEKASQASMGIAIIFFAILAYHQHFDD